MSKPKQLLCLDAGNSLIKWCVHSDPTKTMVHVTKVWCEPTVKFESVAECVMWLERVVAPHLKTDVQAVLFSNVLGPVFHDAVEVICQRRRIESRALTVNTQHGIRSVYEKPASLGKDRWAVCLAVADVSDSPVNLVVSFGTATTLDALVKNANWVHEGGFIVPGLGTMLKSLQQCTAQLPQALLPEFERTQAAWPRNTERAIGTGVVRMQVAWLESLANELLHRHGQVPSVWFCGGFAKQMQPLYPRARILENAVFKGLVVDYLARDGLV